MFGFDDAVMLANTKAGAELAKGVGTGIAEAAKGIFGDDTGVMQSGGGPIDSRGFLDGSQWTVSTGKGKATGGNRTSGEAFPGARESTSRAPEMLQAGGGMTGLLLAGFVVLMLISKPAKG